MRGRKEEERVGNKKMKVAKYRKKGNKKRKKNNSSRMRGIMLKRGR